MAIENLEARSTRVIAALHRLRLEKDLTYDEFASEIGVSRRNLFRLMNDRRAGMHDRTLHKLQRYVDAQRAPRRRLRVFSPRVSL
jgi:transcriptional regulator with XRE-family HTH domain